MTQIRRIDIFDQSELVNFDPARIRKFVRTLDALLPTNLHAPKGDLSIAIFNNNDIAKIHSDFMNKPDATDVITFEGDHDGLFAGEICICVERAMECAANYGNTPDKELCLYIAHGYLHLAGVDDIAPEDAIKMRAAEAEAMNILNKKFKKPIFYFKK